MDQDAEARVAAKDLLEDDLRNLAPRTQSSMHADAAHLVRLLVHLVALGAKVVDRRRDAEVDVVGRDGFGEEGRVVREGEVEEVVDDDGGDVAGDEARGVCECQEGGDNVSF